jgi:hypothetical protein
MAANPRHAQQRQLLSLGSINADTWPLPATERSLPFRPGSKSIDWQNAST